MFGYGDKADWSISAQKRPMWYLSLTMGLKREHQALNIFIGFHGSFCVNMSYPKIEAAKCAILSFNKFRFGI